MVVVRSSSGRRRSTTVIVVTSSTHSTVAATHTVRAYRPLAGGVLKWSGRGTTYSSSYCTCSKYYTNVQYTVSRTRALYSQLLLYSYRLQFAQYHLLFSFFFLNFARALVVGSPLGVCGGSTVV